MLCTVSFGNGVSQKMEANSPLQTLLEGKRGSCSVDVGFVSREPSKTL